RTHEIAGQTRARAADAPPRWARSLQRPRRRAFARRWWLIEAGWNARAAQGRRTQGRKGQRAEAVGDAVARRPHIALVGLMAAGNATLEEVLEAYATDGFAGAMVFVDDCQLRCTTCRTVSPANTLTFTSIRRMEGASDPADMLAVVAVRCPACSTGATL